MEDRTWEMFSPMCFKFRAYYIEENKEQIMKAFASSLEQFRFCDEIQIEITAPPKGPAEATVTNEKRSNINSANTVVKGFAG